MEHYETLKGLLFYKAEKVKKSDATSGERTIKWFDDVTKF